MANENIKPGSWREEPLGSFSQDGEVDHAAELQALLDRKPAKPSASPGLVEMFKVFQESRFGQASGIRRIYYPSCEIDTSIAVAFPAAGVTFADINESAVQRLKEDGRDARCMDATAWVPDEEMDLVLLLNPQIPPDVPARAVRPGGFVLANDYHGTADQLRMDPEFEFVGVIERDPFTGRTEVKTDDLEEYWKEVETDEEFRSARFSFGKAVPQLAEDAVRVVYGDTENVLERYKRLIEEARKQEEARGMRTDLGGLSYEHNGVEITLLTDLPKKKGAVDDLFIFQRKDREDTRPGWMKKKEVGRGNVAVDGKVYPYTILSKDVEPHLPGFLGFPKGEHLIVAEEVPVEYRPHVLSHEVREFTTLAGEEGRCLSSLKRELEGVPEEMRPDYIAYRRDFFELLVAYYQDSADESFKEEIEKSLVYLQTL